MKEVSSVKGHAKALSRSRLGLCEEQKTAGLKQSGVRVNGESGMKQGWRCRFCRAFVGRGKKY